MAAVDADDKVLAYRNWLGILQGHADRGGRQGRQDASRAASTPTALYTGADAARTCTLHGRSLLFVRNVGHLMTNPAMLWARRPARSPRASWTRWSPPPIALHDLQAPRRRGIRNSRTGSIYIVKPKMHGPDEVAFASELFGRVEELLGLPDSTVKLGIMDEERRTSVNLQGLHRRGAPTAWPSSTPASSTAPATRSTPRCRPGR